MIKALVVDDSRSVRMIVSKMLLEMGCEVMEATGGREAVDVLERECYDFNVMLTDWNMPEMNGLELIRHVRTKNEGRRMPIIMVTTESEESQVRAAMDAGANDYVMKPFTRDILKARLSASGVSG